MLRSLLTYVQNWADPFSQIYAIFFRSYKIWYIVQTCQDQPNHYLFIVAGVIESWRSFSNKVIKRKKSGLTSVQCVIETIQQLKSRRWKTYFVQSMVYKGSLISEVILTLVLLPINGVKSRPWSESLNFSPFTVKDLFKNFAQGQDLAPYLGNVKTSSEIKPPSKICYIF